MQKSYAMKKNKSYLILLILLLVLTESLLAFPVRLRIPDTLAVAKDTIDIPVLVDSTITDSNVVSYQLEISYNANRLKAIGVISSGTLSESWTDIEFDIQEEGRITLAAAGISPLSGTGIIIRIRFYAKESGNAYIRFDPDASSFFNEGRPQLLLDDGSVSIAALPAIKITPDNVLLTSGEEQQFSVSGGTSPYEWSLTVDSVAFINSKGLLTAERRGFTRVVVEDAEGIKDTTDELIEVRALQLSFHDTAAWQGSIVSVPLYTSDMSGLNIVSGEVMVSYNSNALQIKGISGSGALLSDADQIEYDVDQNGGCAFSFAGTTSLSGSGILIYLDMHIDSHYTASSYLEVDYSCFNQDIFGTDQRGRLDITPLPELQIDPLSLKIKPGETEQFTVSNGTAPYIWDITDTSVATINADGLLTATGGGVTKVTVEDNHGAKGNNDLVWVYSTELTLPDTSIQLDEGVIIPLYITGLPKPEGLVAYEIKLNYDTTYLELEDVHTPGTLSEGWMLAHNQSGNQLLIAAAGTDTIYQKGQLLKLHFQFKPQADAGRKIPLEFVDVSLNEGFPFAGTHDGSIEALGSVVVNDVGVISIDYPESACGFTEGEAPIVTVKNFGTETIASGTDIPVNLSVNEHTTLQVSYMLNHDFQPGFSLIVEFTQTIDMSAAQKYDLKAYTVLDGDPNAFNDSLSKTITAYGYPSVDVGPETIVTNELPVLLEAEEGFVAYEWQDGSTKRSVSADSYGRYYLTATDTNGCSGSDTVFIMPALDIGVSEIFEPVSSCALSDTEYVRVTVMNYGTAVLSEGERFTIVLEMDDLPPMVETHTMISDISAGETFPHRFAPRLNFSDVGNHTLVAYTDVDLDNQISNDTSALTVTVYGYPEVDLGADTIEADEFPVLLDAGAGFINYEWQDRSNNQTFSANTAGLYHVVVTDVHGCNARDSVYIKDVSTDIAGVDVNQTLLVYPNPSNGIITVMLPEVNQHKFDLEVVDMLGKVVYSHALSSGEMHKLTLDIAHLDPGIYMLRLVWPGRLEFIKIVLE